MLLKSHDHPTGSETMPNHHSWEAQGASASRAGADRQAATADAEHLQLETAQQAGAAAGEWSCLLYCPASNLYRCPQQLGGVPDIA